jgi:hypothetical protein
MYSARKSQGADIEPLHADPWVINSLLQKSIRRGDIELAQRAALTFLSLKGSAIWRRLMIIAFEDVGAGCPDAVIQTVAACSDPGVRKSAGGNVAVALRLAQLLAAAPKDRSPDYIFCAAKDHPIMGVTRHACDASSLSHRLAEVARPSLALPERAAYAWYASGIECGRERRVGKGDLPALLQICRDLGAPDQLVGSTEVAAMRTREPITVMVPLVWLEAHASPVTVSETIVPPTRLADGVPMYALDKHTRLGRDAIRRFAHENDAVREVLEHHVPKHARREAAYMAAFYADAVPVAKRLVWEGTKKVEALGAEADMFKVGVPVEGIQPLLEAFRGNLDHLDKLRAEVFIRSPRGIGEV